MNEERTYVAIDLKSFYASVECVERGLDPLTTNLVVADESRTDKTICLAVSPSLKSYGVPGRPRLFEVKQILQRLPHKVEFITAPPRMAKYIDYSTRIYKIYLRFIAPEDIHVYSIDEVFMDVTAYLKTYKMTAHELTMAMVREVLKSTGITATAGIGTNMYLCKIAMDIVAKHIPADKDGVRIAELDTMSYRRMLWNHFPITDFWRVGGGTARRLALYGIYTMGQLARFSLTHEPLLYKLFGINAELLIDHAWGYEPCTIDLVKAYRPETNSLCSGQVLTRAYDFAQAKVVVQEMADSLALDLVDKGVVTDQLVLTIGYDVEGLSNPETRAQYHGEVVLDRYGRQVPKHAHGTANLKKATSSTRMISDAVAELFDKIVNPLLPVRRIGITANRVVRERISDNEEWVQLDLFDDPESQTQRLRREKMEMARERRMQEALLAIKKRYGKNSVLKGLNYSEGATAKERNQQIGGHKA